MNDKKAERKRKKFVAKLETSKGIIYSESPTPNIVLCNVGQSTGLEKDIVYKSIKQLFPDITLPKYIADKGESYSYLVFNNLEFSELFYNTCNAKLKLENSDPIIYMIYVKNVPDTETIIANENPNGLHLLENFISKDEEQHFIKLFDWPEDIDSNSLKNRQVKHYGYEFRYGTNDVDLDAPLPEKIPSQCDILWTRLTESGIRINNKPDQLTVNKYLPGQGIPSHVDKHSPFGGTILSVSLNSDVVMDWKHSSGKFVPVLVPARSMLVMTDEARYDWQHGIQPRIWDPIIEHKPEQNIRVITNDTVNRGTRISLTFRWTRTGPCECGYKTLCNSISKSTEDIEDKLATNLEELHVHQVYEQIANHFSTTRHKPWPKVVEFMSGVGTGAVVLDLGCGNGKNISKRNDVLQLAGERSSGLLAECKNSVRDVPAADCIRLDLLDAGLRDECADVVICIAVIHHFSSKVRRIQSIATIARLLRPGGRALITVWAKDQTKSNYLCKNKDQEVKSETTHSTVGGLSLPVHENRTQFQHNDLLVPWKLRNVQNNKLQDQPSSTLLRYYHVFEERELEELCNEIPSLRVERSFYEEGNRCVICKKI